MSSPAITYLVAFLTRPLTKIHAPSMILALQLALHSALSSAPPTSLHLSATCPPPPELQRACLVAGISWAEWIALLSHGLEVRLFLSEFSVAVELGRMPRRVLWSFKPESHASRSSAARPTGRSFSASRVRAAMAALPTSRVRVGAALNPTRVPTLLSCSYTVEDVSAVADCDFSDSDSEDDSDAESDSGCSFTSVSSASSASSTSSVCAYTPYAPAKADVKRYTYEGGATQVLSGRVMLGSASAARPVLQRQPRFFKPSPTPAAASAGAAARLRKAASSAASAASSWRKSA
ncbi:hypothetical protein DFH08DRAFT_1076413 [Mycena albidolilacea]|uniref:Uncharacterized protein n=1 Tax=Mycena albidolilacea TaxID=1033008 RepID=A0AAD7ACN3_9AGAR|nr:hypothetical protein DFH08DRAFT_1076413 [Mycena albidolilacea]